MSEKEEVGSFNDVILAIEHSYEALVEKGKIAPEIADMHLEFLQKFAEMVPNVALTGPGIATLMKTHAKFANQLNAMLDIQRAGEDK